MNEQMNEKGLPMMPIQRRRIMPYSRWVLLGALFVFIAIGLGIGGILNASDLSKDKCCLYDDMWNANPEDKHLKCSKNNEDPDFGNNFTGNVTWRVDDRFCYMCEGSSDFEKCVKDTCKKDYYWGETMCHDVAVRMILFFSFAGVCVLVAVLFFVYVCYCGSTHKTEWVVDRRAIQENRRRRRQDERREREDLEMARYPMPTPGPMMMGPPHPMVGRPTPMMAGRPMAPPHPMTPGVGAPHTHPMGAYPHTVRPVMTPHAQVMSPRPY